MAPISWPLIITRYNTTCSGDSFELQLVQHCVDNFHGLLPRRLHVVQLPTLHAVQLEQATGQHLLHVLEMFVGLHALEAIHLRLQCLRIVDDPVYYVKCLLLRRIWLLLVLWCWL